ncbi:Chaperone protein DnaK, partial [Linum perenne]
CYFNDTRPKTTKEVGVIAGLNFAIVYALNPKNARERRSKRKRSNSSKILVYDLGGRTFDVSVMLNGRTNSNSIFRIHTWDGCAIHMFYTCIHTLIYAYV